MARLLSTNPDITGFWVWGVGLQVLGNQENVQLLDATKV